MTDVATRLARVSLRSNDVDRAAAWYCRVFGFRETVSSTAPPRDSALLRLVDGAAGCATSSNCGGAGAPVVADGGPPDWATALASRWWSVRERTRASSVLVG